MIPKNRMFVIYTLAVLIPFANSGTIERGNNLLKKYDHSIVERNSSIDLAKKQWEVFKLQYNKIYRTQNEEAFRMKIYLDNARIITKHNRLYEQGLVSFSMKENVFADLLPHEFSQVTNGYLKIQGESEDASIFEPPVNIELPKGVDWRKSGAVTGVKNQRKCSSCWAFSAIASLESHHFIKTKRLLTFSEQNLIDCAGFLFGNYGCNGGFINMAFEYVKQNNGIDTESSYPYEAGQNECRYDSRNSGTTITGYQNIRQGNESDLQWAVATVGPISVTLDARHQSFRFYDQGVYYEPECSTEIYNHAVLIVGYDTDDNGEDYWIVKNSWGTNWGNKGYIHIARNKANSCGIATRPIFPVM